MQGWLLVIMAAVGLSGIALPFGASPKAAVGTGDGRRPPEASSAQSAPTPSLVPPVPHLVRRPSRAAAVADPAPLIPPVPQPAIRPQRLAALTQPQLAPLIPPVPKIASRPPRRNAKSDGPRACLRPAARTLLDRIEAEFGPVQIVSTCRRGARVAGSGRISKHATGEAVDFDAGSHKREVVRWLIANHTTGGTMTYADMRHIHVDIGQHFVALNAASGR